MPTTLTNPYTTAEMLEALFLFREPRTFLSKMFFNRSYTSRQKTVEIDIRKGPRTVSPYVKPHQESTRIQRPGFSTRTYTPPMLANILSITEEDLMERLPGETQYQDSDRASALMAQDLVDLMGIFERSEELQAAQGLFSGMLTLKDEDNATLETIDFLRNTANMPAALSGSNRWDQTGSTPKKDIELLAENVDTHGDAVADIMICGFDAWNALENNASIIDQLKEVRGNQQEFLAREARELGATYRGTICGLETYTYKANYVDLGSTLTEMVPRKSILIGSRQAYCRRLYAGIMVGDEQSGSAQLVATERWPDSKLHWDPISLMVRMRSKPMLVPHQIDAFAVQQVIS